MKAANKKPDKQTAASKLSGAHEKAEIKTDLPLSEKDEIKQAEERLRRFANKQD